jgi:hypothetical protein
MTTTIGKTEFTARPGFRIVHAADPHISPMWAWGEVRYFFRRRLKYQIFVGQAISVTKSFPSTVAQKFCESLSSAVHNRRVSKTQEVYGIGVRHTFFSVWHAGVHRCSYI